MKRIGIGLSDFKHLIEEDFYYFDKTKFIDEIIKPTILVYIIDKIAGILNIERIINITKHIKDKLFTRPVAEPLTTDTLRVLESRVFWHNL